MKTIMTAAPLQELGRLCDSLDESLKRADTRCDSCGKTLTCDDRMWFEQSAIVFCSPMCRVHWLKKTKQVKP